MRRLRLRVSRGNVDCLLRAFRVGSIAIKARKMQTASMRGASLQQSLALSSTGNLSDNQSTAIDRKVRVEGLGTDKELTKAVCNRALRCQQVTVIALSFEVSSM